MANMNHALFCRTAALLLALATVVATADAAAADPPSVARRTETAWVDGSVEIAAPPNTIRAAVIDVPSWARTFSDVSSVVLKKRDGKRQIAAVRSQIRGGHAHDFTVIDFGSRVELTIDITGADARGIFSVTPGPTEGTSRVAFALYARPSGVAGIFLSEATLRTKQQAIVRAYLSDLARSATKER